MIYIVAAYSKNKIIGKNNALPWNIKGELKRFKELTTNHICVMGRLTFESIGKPLPNRLNVIISKTKEFKGDNLITFSSFKQALQHFNNEDIYIIGGAKIFQQAIDIADKLYITEIDFDYDGDTYFPEFDKSKYKKEINEEITSPIPYKYVTYTKIK